MGPQLAGYYALKEFSARKTLRFPRSTILFGEAIILRKKSNQLGQIMQRFALKATKATGTSKAFIVALTVIVVWGLTGPLFHFSDTWQLVINTGTTIVTFLMVFLIQRTQNKDALAIHLKLNEIVAALEGASNRLIDVEDLTEEEIETLHSHYQKLVAMAKKDLQLTQSHSIEEAQVRHNIKHSKHRHDTKP
jgi:low affinity Fe/Cu permease